jgi:hypothetical protein
MRVLSGYAHFSPSLLLLALSTIMIGTGGSGVQAQTGSVRVENGFEGTLEVPPKLVERAAFVDAQTGVATLYRPSYLIFDDAGNAYIPDPGAHAVLVFDRNARFKRKIGREGEGPGEMKWPSGVHISFEGILVVPDPDNQRWSYFSTDGEFLKSERVSTGSTITLNSSRDFIKTPNGEYLRIEWVYSSPRQRQRKRENRSQLEVLGSTGKVNRSIGQQRSHEDPMVESLINQFQLACTPTGKAIAAFRYGPEIHTYDLASGELEMVITRDLAFRPREPSVEVKTAASPDGRSTMTRVEPVADDVTLDVASDGEGRIWALTYLVGQEDREALEDEGRFDQMVRLEVFGQQGRLLAVYPLSEPYSRLAFDPQGDLWLMDRSYNMTIRRFEVIWP